MEIVCYCFHLHPLWSTENTQNPAFGKFWALVRYRYSEWDITTTWCYLLHLLFRSWPVNRTRCCGSYFTNAVSLCPVIGPARVSWMGQGPWTSGVLRGNVSQQVMWGDEGSSPRTPVALGGPLPIVPRGLKYPLNIAQAFLQLAN